MYSNIRAVRVCAARKPPISPFLAWATPKDSTFSTWTAPKSDHSPRRCGWGGVYSNIRAVRVCAARKTPFLAWAAPKDSTFSTWTAPKDPPFKIDMFLCYFLFQNPPCFSVRGRSESPPISVRGRSLSPPIFNTSPQPSRIIVHPPRLNTLHCALNTK